MARVQQKARGRTTGWPNIRPSLRNGFTAYTCSPWCAGLFGHHIATNAPKRAVRDTSVGVSGPHDFAVRIGMFVGANDHAAFRHAHRIPLPTSVTFAKRPSQWRRDRRKDGSDLPDKASRATCGKLTRRAICAEQPCLKFNGGSGTFCSYASDNTAQRLLGELQRAADHATESFAAMKKAIVHDWKDLGSLSTLPFEHDRRHPRQVAKAPARYPDLRTFPQAHRHIGGAGEVRRHEMHRTARANLMALRAGARPRRPPCEC
jgi:hypothetical protein